MEGLADLLASSVEEERQVAFAFLFTFFDEVSPPSIGFLPFSADDCWQFSGLSCMSRLAFPVAHASLLVVESVWRRFNEMWIHLEM
jgi:hypothetical protein